MARLCGTSYGKVSPKYYDPLGPAQFDKRGKPIYGATGAPEMRSSIFSQLSALQPGLMDKAGQTAGAMRTAANNPGYAAGADLANKTLRGDFLGGSPQLEALLSKVRAANAAEGANAAGRVQSQFQSNGLPWSTANQQAQQSATAAATARSDATDAATRLQDYQAERASQGQAVNMLDQSTSSPLRYMQQAGSAEVAPLNDVAQLIAGLAGHGELVKPDVLEKASLGAQGAAAIGSL